MASARMGLRTALFSFNLDLDRTDVLQSREIGGIAKGPPGAGRWMRWAALWMRWRMRSASSFYR